MINLTSAVEAILFAAGDSVPIARLSLILGVDEHDIECAAAELQEYYSANSRGMRILRLEDKLQMCSAPEYAAYITKALEQRKPPVLSQPRSRRLPLLRISSRSPARMSIRSGALTVPIPSACFRIAGLSRSAAGLRSRGVRSVPHDGCVPQDDGHKLRDGAASAPGGKRW